MISSTRRALTVSVFALTTLMATAASAAEGQKITIQEVCAAQKAWGGALVAISDAYDEGPGGNIDKAREVARTAIATAYGYNLGPVLFKPTVAGDPQTYRLTKEGALAYFVGHEPQTYPADKGFAIQHWRAVEVWNVGVQFNGDTATAMSRVDFFRKPDKPDKPGATEKPATSVDKTWVFKKDEYGVVRIILHHSSLVTTPKHPFVNPGVDPCPATPAG